MGAVSLKYVFLNKNTISNCLLTDTIIKIKNAIIEIELHGSDLIKQYTQEDGTDVKNLANGVPEILEYIQQTFRSIKIK